MTYQREVEPQSLNSSTIGETLAGLFDSFMEGDGKRAQELKRASKTSDGYRETYLQSDEWRLTRKAVLRIQGNVCHDCGFWGSTHYSLDVHHLTYKRLGHEELSDLVVLCRRCHDKRHGKAP